MTKLVLNVDAISPPLTGIGRYAWELASRLPAVAGMQAVRFCGIGGWIQDPARLLESGPVSSAARKRLAASSLARWVYQRAMPVVQRYRFRQFEDWIYHGPNFMVPPFPGRCVATLHDLSILDLPHCHPPERVNFMRREIETARRRASLLITDSEYVRREVISRLGVDPGKVRAVPLAASDEFHPRARPQIEADLAALNLDYQGYVLCVATIEPRKNLDMLIRAYRELPRPLRMRYRLVLAGDRGWRSEATHAAIMTAAAEGWLVYLGYVEERRLPGLYAGARGFAYPSRYEGFGLPLLEAMASGLPVVATTSTSLPEVAGEAGTLVDPDDAEGLLEALRTLLEDDSGWQASSERSLRCARRFSWERTVAETAACYRALG